MKSNKSDIKFSHLVILIALSVICILGHFLTPPSKTLIHDFLFKFTYLPIVLSALWFGKKVSITLTLIYCSIYLFHIFMHLHIHGNHHMHALMMELGLFNIIAYLTGHLSDLEKERRLKVSHHADELKKVNEELKAKTKTILDYEEITKKYEKYKIMGELSATVAHEVRTPIAALQGSIEVITSEKSDLQTKQKFSKLVFQEIKRINDFVTNFLDLSKIKRPDLEQLNLNSLIKDCVELMNPKFSKANITIDIDNSKEHYCLANKGQLKQVIINLLMNSVESIEESNQQGEINIIFNEEEKNIEMLFVDSGPGIQDDLNNKLFEPFHTTKSNGTGLGLYISKSIMHSFNGELELIDTKPGHTSFRIKLPRNDHA